MSDLEELFAFQLKVARLPVPTREHRFAPPRRWRLDFAWPAQLVGVEVDGGSWVGGRHNRASGFAKDLEKHNAATLLGWRILRLTGGTVADGSGLTLLEELLGEHAATRPRPDAVPTSGGGG